MNSEIFAHSSWIWPERLNWDLHNCYALFRREFKLGRVPEKAPLYITADQSYQLYVNGEYVCRGPARGFQSSWPYDEVDIASYLHRGRNVLAVRAHNPGFSNYQYVTNGYAGLIVAARWGDFVLRSDASWKSRRQAGIERDTVPTSAQLFCQEHIDLRMEDPDWMLPEYDDHDWTSTTACHAWNGMPWPGLEPRGLPLLDEENIFPVKCLGTASGISALDYLATRDVTRIRHSEGLAHHCESQAAEVISIPASGKKLYRSYLIDFGKTVVGSLGLHITGAHGGEVIDTLHAETIDEQTLEPHYMPDRYCRMAFGCRLIARGGDQGHVFYHPFGFRYVVITVRDSESTLDVRPYLRAALYPLEQKGRFHSSDRALQAIWDASAWTQRVCCMDSYVDTPWREQAQWWGDARVQGKNTFFYSGDTRLFRRGIAQIASQTLTNGLTYGHAPTAAHGCILPDFTLTWMITLWDYYWQTGSLEPFATHQETVERALHYFESKIDPSMGLAELDKRYWLFLDWSELFKEGYSAVYNLWILIAFEKMAALYRLIGRCDMAASLELSATELRSSLSRLTNQEGLVCDGFRYDGERVETTSIHAQTLAILADFQSEYNASRINKVLLPFICSMAHTSTTPSCYWLTYVFEVLTSVGQGHHVVEYIRHNWKEMARYGTTWEVFNPRLGDESHSHAWSAHPLYHLIQTLGGIRQSGVQWKQIDFQPCFIGSDCAVSVPTPQGNVESHWSRSENGIHVVLSLPKGIAARVHLPGRKSELVRGRASWVIQDGGVRSIRSSETVSAPSAAITESGHLRQRDSHLI